MKIVQNLLKNGLTGKRLTRVKGIVIHWVANPGSTANGNRNYWERLGSGVSAHFIIDLDGTVMQTAPENAMCYHVGSKTYTSDALRRLSVYPNDCTIGIEMTHPDASGKPSAAIYNSAVELTAMLCKKYGLSEKDVWLHKEVVGWKDCHRWFVNNPAEWSTFKAKVGQEMNPSAPKPVQSKPAPAPQPKNGTHVVSAGESLSVIAAKHGISVDNLAKWNNIKNPNLIQVGEVLKVVAPVAPKPAPAPKKGNMTTDSITVYLDSIGVNSSFANRSKLATQYGISGYKGTAAQNLKLLDLMRKGSSPKPAPKAPVVKPAPAKPKYVLPTGTLKYGMRGTAVKQLQIALNAANFNCGNPDGSFGPATLDALKRFQSVYANPVDGIYGATTRAALAKKLGL